VLDYKFPESIEEMMNIRFNYASPVWPMNFDEPSEQEEQSLWHEIYNISQQYVI
jgi:hypothetical protein